MQDGQGPDNKELVTNGPSALRVMNLLEKILVSNKTQIFLLSYMPNFPSKCNYLHFAVRSNTPSLTKYKGEVLQG